MQIKLSVLVTCYNQKKYIEEAIDSVYAQKCDFPLEVIVGDDGSDDGSYELLQERYGRRDNFKVIANICKSAEIPPATSASRMRVELLDHVRGEYFLYLDGDDFFSDSSKFQKQLEILDANPNLAFCGGNFYFYYQSDRPKELFTGGMKEGFINLKDYWKSNYMSANTCVFRSCIIRAFPRGLISDVFHDNLIVFCAMLQGGGYYMDSPGMCYRQEDNGNHIYVGSAEMVTWIRHTIMADVCDIIGPQYQRQSWHRYHRFFVELFMHRRRLDNDDSLQYWIGLAEKLGCRKTLAIVHYNDFCMGHRMWIRIKYLFIIVQDWGRRVLSLRWLIKLIVKMKRAILGLIKEN